MGNRGESQQKHPEIQLNMPSVLAHAPYAPECYVRPVYAKSLHRGHVLGLTFDQQRV